MKTITYETNPLIDKTGWPSGEWDREPDKVQFEDKDTGYPCLAVRNRMGAWCGYVGVPNDHFFYGSNYDDVESPRPAPSRRATMSSRPRMAG